ncbi:MAG: cytochrome c oxidase subunit II [Pseudomonadota bacterium]|nr:cytochrome c oxidase subunit II [Pseudomonadota bacterium]
MAPAIVFADELNMPVGVTSTSREIYDLHMLIFWICVAIGVVVFGAMLYSMIAHRKSVGHEPANFHESTKLELAWTIVPVFILIGMAIPATDVLVRMYDTGGEDMVIEVRGYQWKWQYKYLDEDLNEQVSFFSNLATPRTQIQNVQEKPDTYLLEVDNPLIIPVGRKVRFLLTSNDVIHSWWVPDFAVKKDAIPGFINESWTMVEQPGVYRGQCTELCGKDHGFMPVVVRALPAEEYDAWYAEQLGVAAVAEETIEAEAEQQWSDEVLLAKGEEIYSDHCVACHQANGAGVPPVFPAIAGSAVATGPVDTHLDVVYNGRPGTAMQAFGQQLSATEIAAVMHYQRNAFGNDTGDVVQPQDVLAYSQGR